MSIIKKTILAGIAACVLSQGCTPTTYEADVQQNFQRPAQYITSVEVGESLYGAKQILHVQLDTNSDGQKENYTIFVRGDAAVIYRNPTVMYEHVSANANTTSALEKQLKALEGKKVY